MRPRLYIYLSAQHLDQPDWVVDNLVYHGDIERLANAAKERDVIIIVPAEEVVLLSVVLPPMSRSRLRAALPFALEEQCISDVEALHFAMGDYQADGSLPVAVVARDKMQSWLSLLQSWRIEPVQMVSEVFTLPFKSGHWHIIIRDELAVARTGLYHGFASDLSNLSLMLEAARTQTPELNHITVCTYSPNIDITRLQEIAPTTMLAHDAADMLNDMTTQLAMHPSMLNLLQGDYASTTSRFPALKHGWKVVAYLAATLVVVGCLSPLVSYFMLQQRSRQIDQQISRIYYKYFPQATTIVAPKQRLDEMLQRAVGHTQENQPLLALAYLGNGLSQVTNIKIKRFDYQRDRIQVELTAATSDDFSRFIEVITQQGMQVHEQNAAVVEGRINGTLQIAW